MGYLRYRDYSRQIQDVNLSQILSNDDSIRLDIEVAAEAEVKGYLSSKYDIDTEFSHTFVWSPSIAYKGYALVELNYPDYVPATSYVINDLVTYLGKCYICIATTTGAFNPVKWTLLGTKYDLFHIVPTAPDFNYKGYYSIGDQVFWKNKIYTAVKSSPILDHNTALQYGRVSSLPYPNVFPDDPIDGKTYWGTGTAFSVAAGTLPTNAAWTKGDNRATRLVQITVDICLYHLHSRIAPRNIPQLRMDRYAAAIAYLDMILSGKISSNIPLNQPKTDGMIRWGGDVKRDNSY